MVDIKDCSFCGKRIEPGTGKMYVKKSGEKFLFCSLKCQKNQLILKRVSRNVKWTSHFVKGGKKAAGQMAEEGAKAAKAAPPASEQ